MAKSRKPDEIIDSPEMTEAIEQATETEGAVKKSRKVREKGTPLAGQELLAYTQQNAAAGKTADELAYGAGFYTKVTDKETSEVTIKADREGYFQAVTTASCGVVVTPSKRAYSPRRNRAAEITVGGTGNCVVGARYTAEAGFAPGSKVAVAVDGNRVILTAAAPESDKSDDVDL